MKFYQEPPDIENQYLEDELLKTYLKVILPEPQKKLILEDLERMGYRTMHEIKGYGDQAMDNEPILVNFEPWGRRVDEVVVSDGWNKLKDVAAEEGLLEIGYSRKYEEFSRIYQMAKLMLYTPSSAIYTCPLAMTDGAARLIETLAPQLLSEPFNHLVSDNPDEFWVAGQWMTEREGGSDVAMSSAIARKEGEKYRIYGDKWFTSAIDAQVAMMLARIEQEDGSVVEGSRGLSLFYLRIRDDEGNLNNITLHKLKDKLGTRALPTAELTLEGAEATLIGEIGRGVKQITTILNITRIYNAVSSISYMQRGVSLTKDYAKKRLAFGRMLDQLPLHQETLANLEVEYWGSFLLVFHTIGLMGKVETEKASADEEAIFRLLTPLSKLYTGKKAVAVISEVVESIGGMGYIEDSGIPVLMRDAQVFPIWEGTTNVLSLDVLRAMIKEGGIEQLLNEIEEFIVEFAFKDFDLEYIKDGLEDIEKYLKSMQEEDRDFSERGAREFSFSLANIIIAYLLLRFYQRLNEGEEFKKKVHAVYTRWIERHPIILLDQNKRGKQNDLILY